MPASLACAAASSDSRVFSAAMATSALLAFRRRIASRSIVRIMAPNSAASGVTTPRLIRKEVMSQPSTASRGRFAAITPGYAGQPGSATKAST
jgi:hypothetical protein